ncbi:lytic murein transglycosylase [Stenotrophomonas sp. HITSZ_GD]|uniref:lytic murein transglycosylase n=1 Tax=Stenotrophomonas sp. HITSZ_GD TaxID=3037248 RepID=UPI00240D7183|nr:lytic murein transglycosylase [Stenotrophomonas sp. HITSZ_GD]MDG2524108.1 lytic murein transglycosylase [Stenotrophomonas sp. HITSZ_GD]
MNWRGVRRFSAIWREVGWAGRLGLVAGLALALPASAAGDATWARCLSTLRAGAQAQGITLDVFDQHMAGVQADPSVLALLDAQPEFTTPLWDYLAALVDDERVADGKAFLARYRGLLDGIAAQYGVDAETVVAVWGVESDYGRVTGKRPLLVSLATLSCEGRRQPFFRGELFALLQLLQDGDLAVAPTGSWAGAFGQTQFMPTTYRRIAVDGDGDGRRDLVGSVPDALASTANYLARAGWRTGEPWGEEVVVPEGADTSRTGRTQRRPLREWRALGVRGVEGRASRLPQLADDTPAALLLPTGAQGPAFLVFANYDAIYAYNAAESYALAIALLSDRLRGGTGLATAWPTPDPALDRAGRRALQRLLIARGHALGTPDGMLGNATRRAIQAEQQRLGLQPADGRAGQSILAALRAEMPAPAVLKGTAFRLPAAYPRFVQSPLVSKQKAMKDVPGLSTGDFHGFPSLLVTTPHSTAAISLFGGQLLSFVPAGQEDVMWLSPRVKPAPTPIRGGTPVCWPYFGRQDQTDDVPAHGFVRTLPWQLLDASREPDGTLVLHLAPPVLEDLALRLRMTLRIGRTLEQTLETQNVSGETVRFTQALHNYFHVGDALQVSAEGVDGLDYVDKFENYAVTRRQQGDWNLRDPRDPGRSDRIYLQAGGQYSLVDPVLRRRIDLRTEGSQTLVAWNPGEAGAAKMDDVREGWRQYVCLEAANAGPDVIELAPGARHVLRQTIGTRPL